MKMLLQWNKAIGYAWAGSLVIWPIAWLSNSDPSPFIVVPDALSTLWLLTYSVLLTVSALKYREYTLTQILSLVPVEQSV